MEYHIFYSNYKDTNSDIVIWDNGQGEFFKVMFNQNGAIIVGFDHESELSPYSFEPLRLYDENLIKDVPESLKDIFNIMFDDFETLKYQMTYCIWREYKDDRWEIGDLDYDVIHSYKTTYDNATYSNDGSEEAIFFFDGKYESYLEWVNYNYGCIENFTSEIFQHFTENKPATPELIENLKLDPPYYKKNVLESIENLKKMGYPVEES